MASKSSSSSGIGLTGVLFVVFLVLKLTGNIDWSWWWVTSPIWIPILLLLSIVVISLFFLTILVKFGFNIDLFKENIKKNLKK
jgi:hypothetical protein